MGYNHFYWACPYYRRFKDGVMHCEGGRIDLPEDAKKQYFDAYCNDLNGWKRCTVARAISRHYERQDEA